MRRERNSYDVTHEIGFYHPPDSCVLYFMKVSEHELCALEDNAKCIPAIQAGDYKLEIGCSVGRCCFCTERDSNIFGVLLIIGLSALMIPLSASSQIVRFDLSLPLSRNLRVRRGKGDLIWI